MTEQTPEQQTPPPEDTTPPEDTGPAEYAARVPKPTATTGRYAVYDKTLERYVGEVVSKKPTATEAKARTFNGQYAIVEV